MVYRDIPQALKQLIEPVVEDHGLELVDAELVRGRGPAALRVIVDTSAGDGRVPVDRCAEVSRELGTQLDVHEAIDGAYRLEVSSPGLERVLAREKDFAAVVGREIKLETRIPQDGRRRFRGTVTDFRDGTISLQVDGAPVSVPFDAVAKARAVYEFTSADFARGARN